MSYTQLTQALRYQIYFLNNMGVSQKDIAFHINVHPSTVCRELARHKDNNGHYNGEYAHQMALENRKRLKYLKRFLISHEWIYQYILRDKKQGGNLYKHLRCKKKNRRRYGVKRNCTNA